MKDGDEQQAKILQQRAHKAALIQLRFKYPEVYLEFYRAEVKKRMQSAGLSMTLFTQMKEKREAAKRPSS